MFPATNFLFASGVVTTPSVLCRKCHSAVGSLVVNSQRTCCYISDPALVLDHAVEIQKKAHKAQDLDLENKKLRETLDEYNNEFAEVKNQGKTVASWHCSFRRCCFRFSATNDSVTQALSSKFCSVSHSVTLFLFFKIRVSDFRGHH